MANLLNFSGFSVFPLHYCLSIERNSCRYSIFSNTPEYSMVCVVEHSFSTPRMRMHMWVASQNTITPLAESSRVSRSQICRVMRSCTCSRRAKTSTARAILLSPTMFPSGIYPIAIFPKKGSMWCSQSEWNSMSLTITIREPSWLNIADFTILSASLR